jgi:hypothetical protein
MQIQIGIWNLFEPGSGTRMEKFGSGKEKFGYLWIPIYNYSYRKFIYVSILKPRR